MPGTSDGLERGQNWTAYEEMVASIPNAVAIGRGRYACGGKQLDVPDMNHMGHRSKPS